MNQKFNFFIDLNSLNSLFRELVSFYGFTHWWPADSPLEVVEGAILGQNTSWRNADICVQRIKAIPPDVMLGMDNNEIMKLIKEAGFHKRKIQYLKTALDFYSGRLEPISSFLNVREELLKLKGIGRETADSIALYAFNQRTFPVDSYTLRFFNRYYSLSLSLKDYETIRKAVSAIFDSSVLREFHAAIVEHSKNFCRKIPLCGKCFLREKCRFQ